MGTRKRDGGGGDDGAKDGSRELSLRPHNRLNKKERANYVGAAASHGWTTPLALWWWLVAVVGELTSSFSIPSLL